MQRLLRAFCLVLLCLTGIAQAEILNGKVVGVTDGDTLTLLTTKNRQVKVRLAQIDAPESKQAYGSRSKESLSELAFGKTVTIDVETIDRYGRTVGTILVNGVDVNLMQIKRGMAWVYTQYAHDPNYQSEEQTARANKAGLWIDENPTEPWLWRRGEKPEIVATGIKSKISAYGDASKCGSKHLCKEMKTCEEARFYLTVCGVSRLDGDRDGIPCESICGN